MPSTAIDSQIHGCILSTDEMRRIWSDQSWVQKWLDSEAAANLNESEGTPCLRIRRRYVSARGKTLLITVSYHPGDRYAFNLNVRLDRQKQCVESDLMD